jgi:AP-1 complex subunit beta-1
LLDFDDEPAANGQLSGLAATEVLASTPAAASLLAGTSTNPLDDLVSIFGGGSSGARDPLAGFGLSPVAAPSVPVPKPTSAAVDTAQDDLLGLF